ncbi:MAG: hypothetical protein FWG83_04510 [Oscillospiraceae bacterium]|nr:hypothetical protein [Oscillospiraceae bacterium]
MTSIKQYDKIRLKTGLVGRIMEVIGDNECFIVDVKLNEEAEMGEVQYDTIDIKPSEIKSVFVEHEEPFRQAV